MQNTKILPVVTLGLILATLAADHLVSRLEVVNPKLLSIDTFPRQIGDWTAGQDRHPENEAEIKKMIPTAHTVDRIYSDGRGRWLELTLVSASDYSDLHNPVNCLPGAGWQLSPLVTCNIGADRATSAAGTKDSEQMELLYWFTASPYRYDSVAERLRSLRTFVSGTEGHSLLVRLITKRTHESQQLLRAFAHEIEPPLNVLKAEARRR